MQTFPGLCSNFSQLVASRTDPKFWPGLLNPDEFDIFEKIAWMQNNWIVSVYASIIYLVLIFGLREWMKERQPFDLKGPLIVWNLSLALFSTKGTFVSSATMYKLYTTRGFDYTICGIIDFFDHEGFYWGTLFIFSKIVELGDTLFLVLRKRQLIFLHWYHHISVLIFSWVTYKDVMATGAWAGMMNYTVHAFMYTYFTITAIGWKVPKPIAMSLTAVQFLQMVVNLGIHIYAAQTKLAGNACPGVSSFHLWLAFGLFSSYALLFGKFFAQAYLRGGSRKKMS